MTILPGKHFALEPLGPRLLRGERAVLASLRTARVDRGGPPGDHGRVVVLDARGHVHLAPPGKVVGPLDPLQQGQPPVVPSLLSQEREEEDAADEDDEVDDEVAGDAVELVDGEDGEDAVGGRVRAGARLARRQLLAVVEDDVEADFAVERVDGRLVEVEQVSQPTGHNSSVQGNHQSRR